MVDSSNDSKFFIDEFTKYYKLFENNLLSQDEIDAKKSTIIDNL